MGPAWQEQQVKAGYKRANERKHGGCKFQLSLFHVAKPSFISLVEMDRALLVICIFRITWLTHAVISLRFCTCSFSIVKDLLVSFSLF